MTVRFTWTPDSKLDGYDVLTVDRVKAQGALRLPGGCSNDLYNRGSQGVDCTATTRMSSLFLQQPAG